MQAQTFSRRGFLAAAAAAPVAAQAQAGGGLKVSIFSKLLRFLEIDGRVVVGALPVWALAIIGAVLVCRAIPPVPVALALASAVGAFAVRTR